MEVHRRWRWHYHGFRFRMTSEPPSLVCRERSWRLPYGHCCRCRCPSRLHSGPRSGCHSGFYFFHCCCRCHPCHGHYCCSLRFGAAVGSRDVMIVNVTGTENVNASVRAARVAPRRSCLTPWPERRQGRGFTDVVSLGQGDGVSIKTRYSWYGRPSLRLFLSFVLEHVRG